MEEYEKTRINIQTRTEEAWEDLPFICQKCKFINSFGACKLRDEDDDEDECPLNIIGCEECEHFCDIVKRNGERLKNTFYCLEFDEAFENDKTACREFQKAKVKTKTGHWIKYGIQRCGEQHYKCTSCGYYINFGQWGELYTKEFKYCPNCAAKMRKQIGESDDGK